MEAKDKAEELIGIVRLSTTENLSDKTILEISELISKLVTVQHVEMHRGQLIDNKYYKEFREHFELWRSIKKELEKMKK
ncbi:TPA: hypothetical protein ACG0AP_003566 [Elizabethkingia anophelis]